MRWMNRKIVPMSALRASLTAMENQATSSLRDSDEVSRVIPLQIGPRITEAIGRAHTLESAISDLIDNSISAQADHVHIRFMESERGYVSKIRIRDNGTGMTAEGLSDAMRLNPEGREYGSSELGMFGLGLKASSMSQARELNVYTSDQSGGFHGARLLRSDAGGELDYGVLRSEVAQSEFRGYDNDNSTGTVVEWRSLENVSVAKRQAAREEWLDGALTKLRNHLGLVFHRFISQGQLRITFDRFDEENQRPGPRLQATAINPFGFETSGHQDFPIKLSGRIPKHGPLEMECFIIPPGSKSESAMLMGQDRQKWQGLYIYWRDRLVHFGDWNLLLPESKKEYSLARVRIELQEHHLPVVRLNPEKAQIQLLPPFLEAAQAITDASGEYSLDSFVSASQETLKLSNKRKASVKPMTRIKDGLPEQVIDAIENNAGWRPARHGISIDWAFLDPQLLFDFDASAKLIRLNSRHRVFLSATEANRHEDAPIVRTLLYLLLESFFAGGHIQKSTEMQIDAIQRILSAALNVQLEEIDDHDRLVEDARAKDREAAAAQAKKEQEPKPGPEDVTASSVAVVETKKPSEPAPRPRPKPSPPRSASQPSATRPRAESSAEKTNAPSGQTVIDILRSYRRGTPIPIISAQLGVQERGVVNTLALALFGDGSTLNDRDYAPRHGIAWDPDERSKASKLLRDGTTVPVIAEKLGRTPFSVAWQLLDGPKALPVPDSIIKRFQRVYNLKGSSTPNSD